MSAEKDWRLRIKHIRVEIIWKTIQENLPPLIEPLQTILNA